NRKCRHSCVSGTDPRNGLISAPPATRYLGPLTAVRQGEYWCYPAAAGAEQWPDLRFDLGGLSYPDRLNCAEALLDATIARFGPFFLCVPAPTETWTY